jgi:hypothetical protein
VDQLFRLLLDCFDYFGMTVAGGTNRDAGVAVQKHIAVDVLNPNSAAAFRDEFE